MQLARFTSRWTATALFSAAVYQLEGIGNIGDIEKRLSGVERRRIVGHHPFGATGESDPSADQLIRNARHRPAIATRACGEFFGHVIVKVQRCSHRWSS